MVYLKVKTSDKKFMFNLGRLFARGEQIQIINQSEVDAKIEEEKNLGYAKSFNMMIKYWQVNNLAPNIFTQPKNNMNMFLICPVRRATEKEKKLLSQIISKYEKKGIHVHYPERDTNQNPVVRGKNTGGYNICLQNATAIASANTVSIFYNPQSVGSMFDLGVTYELAIKDPSRRFILENDFKLNKNDYIEKIILKLQQKNGKDCDAIEQWN